MGNKSSSNHAFAEFSASLRDLDEDQLRLLLADEERPTYRKRIEQRILAEVRRKAKEDLR